MESFENESEVYFPSQIPMTHQKNKTKVKSFDDSQSFPQKKNVTWTPTMIQYLVDCMLEIISNQGKRANNGVKKDTYTLVTEEMIKMGFLVSKPNLENKLKYMKTHYHVSELTPKQSGFTLNSLTKCIDADDDVWEKWIQHNKDVKPLRTKGLKYYDESVLMFGKNYATGGANFDDTYYNPQSQVGANETIINLDDTKVLVVSGVPTPLFPLESFKGESQNTAPTTKRRRRSRIANEDLRLPALEKMASVATCTAESVLRPSKKQFNEALKAIPNIEKKDIFRAYNLIVKDDNLIESFFGLDEGDRKEWVKDQLDFQ